MINLKILKKKASLFFISKLFFSILLVSFFSYFIFLGYSYLKNIHNNKAFISLYSLFERFQGSINSTSVIPLQELLKEIEVEKQKLGFLCSIKDQFTLLQSSILLQSNKVDDALLLLKQTLNNDLSNELNYLYHLVVAMSYATNDDINKKQEGIALLKKYADNKKFQDVAIFYYGYFLLKTTSLKKADEAWMRLKHDPQFNNSPYKLLVEQARNCDY
jgi:hypothetical protein